MEDGLDRWQELLNSTSQKPSSTRANACAGKGVLITGGGGFIGSVLAKSILEANPRNLILLEHSEENLYQVDSQMEEQFPSKAFSAVLGDISDRSLLDEILVKQKPDVIFHAAAFKHVPLMEENPFAVIRNNVFGTRVLAEAAIEHDVARLIMISTDKAVNPRSIMGVSKRIAELVLHRLSGKKTQMSAVRFGNVFGSNGSVVPRFREQIAAGGPVCVTRGDAKRYFLTPMEAVELILSVMQIEHGNGVFVPALGEPLSIIELAKRLIASEAKGDARGIEIRISGLRAGEKLSEELVAEGESVESTEEPGLFRANGVAGDSAQVDSGLERLRECVAKRNLAGLLDATCELVPEYRPSDTLMAMLKTSAV